jgi:hypothetical protein
MYKKESVELFAYPNRGSDKTLAQISKSPHLAVYIGMIYSYTNEEVCLAYSRANFETVRFLFESKRETLSRY